jgi:glycosyltransferase involved in cell wall biosynthesis
MPSLREPLGMFQIESQYLGVPTIASNVDGIPETLVHQKTGLLVEPGNVKEWINHITWALQNLDEMKIWAAQGSIYVKEKFSMETNTQQLLKILDIKN